MNAKTLARIDLAEGRRRPQGRFFVQARLPSDGTAHPYGQWSLGVIPFGTVGEQALLAHVDFVAPEAPRAELLRGLELELFRGRERVGSATILVAAPALGLDRDFLAGLSEPPRVEEDLGEAA